MRTLPAALTFEAVNDFVHDVDTSFEDLQGLCLGMAAHCDRLREVVTSDHESKNAFIARVRAVIEDWNP